MSKADRILVSSGNESQWRLDRAILLYSASGGPQHSVYATLHAVIAGKGNQPQLDAGVPATKEACADIARALGAASSLSGFTPPSLLYLGARAILWWRPPGKARMHFDTRGTAAGDQVNDSAQAKIIGHRGAVTPQPGLVFGVRGKDWFVFAVAGDKRPAPATQLLRAPYFNVWSTGGICTGTTPLPKSLSPDTLDAYEEAFFGSNFTHPNIRPPEKLVEWKGGAYQFWREGLDGAWGDAFPAGALIPAKLTLQALAKKLESDRGR